MTSQTQTPRQECKSRREEEKGSDDNSSSNAHLMHAVTHPSHIRIARSDDGRDSALQLESDDGPTTLVRFSNPNTSSHHQLHGGEPQ